MVSPINSEQINSSKLSAGDAEKQQKKRNKIDYGDNFKPPDGGWGWLVCFASGLTNLCSMPFAQQFGLIFRDFFQTNGITNSEITTIINTYHAVSALSEFLIAPFFKYFSCRQIALLGAFILTLGVYLTSFATTFITFLIIYSIIYGFGRGMNTSGKHIAFNIYFKENRTRGTSIIVVISAIGPLFMSYVVLSLLDQFGLNGTILILTAIAFNSFALSLVYKPIKIPQNNTGAASDVTSETYDSPPPKYDISIIENNKDAKPEKDQIPEKTQSTSIHKRIAKCFDLMLLKDIRYCNIIMGLTFAQFVESNFNMLTPFILSDFGYSYSEIALIMTVSRVPDILSRFLCPFIVERINWDNRTFFLISLVAMTSAEFVISMNPCYEIMFACFIWLGIFRGLRMIFNSIILPGYVPLKQLPAATGLHKLVSGFFMLACGPVIGIIRDAGNNYTMPLSFLNTLSVIGIVTWTIDLIYQNINRKSKDKTIISNNNNNCTSNA